MNDENTRALMADIADEAAKRAVERTLLTMGVDPNNPLETQRDMAALRELRELMESDEFQNDLLHLRRWRKAVDGVEGKGAIAAIGFICLGGLALILYAISYRFGGG